MRRPRLLFYCQHLLGVGHLTRSLAISEGLISQFDVVFLQGGPDIGKTLHSPHFKHVFLAPLLMNEKDSVLYDPSHEQTPEAIFLEREKKINLLLQEPFDVVLTELFPFGRNKFKNEVLSLIEKARKANSQVHVSCSIRDILVEKPDAATREVKMLNIVNKYYDSVLVHSDERVLRFEETFSRASQITEKLLYTGFVTEGKKARKSDLRNQDILVSMGGGITGEEMVRAVLSVAPDFSDYRFRFVPGPYAPAQLKEDIRSAAQTSRNIFLEDFLNNFEEELASCALSISLAGYNTVMNLLNTKTPALVYPYMANIEQNLRAQKLKERELLDIVYIADLAPEVLSHKIKTQLSLGRPDFDVNLAGAQNTTEILLTKIGELR